MGEPIQAMQRLLLDAFIEGEEEMLLMQQCNIDSLQNAMMDKYTMELLKKYMLYEQKVKTEHLGKTALFWLSFIEHIYRVDLLLYSVKSNQLRLFPNV